MEYDLLKQSHDCYGDLPAGDCNHALARENVDVEGSRDVEMLAEAKLLRQHKGRLESRMHVLEEHNQQLEWQLSRLRQLLDQVSAITILRNFSENKISLRLCLCT